MEPRSEYLRAEQAARYLNISKSTLDKLRVYGGGPKYYKPVKTVLYSRADLDAWLRRTVRTSTSEAA